MNKYHVARKEASDLYEIAFLGGAFSRKTAEDLSSRMNEDRNYPFGFHFVVPAPFAGRI